MTFQIGKGRRVADISTGGSAASFLTGGGVMGALMRGHDWSHSRLGSVETWPAALRTAIALMLGARQPVYIAWGPELTSFYNDGYLPIVGTKHPGLGKPFIDLWAEIWDQFRPIVEATMTGDAQHFVDLPIPLAGRPGLPVGYFTFSYTALRDDTGQIAGFYCAATETTDKVLAERRQTFMLDLGDRLRTLDDAGEVMQAAAEALGRQIGADRSGYAEVTADDQTFVVQRDWSRGDMASFVGRHRLDDFGPDLIKAFRAGRAVAFEDATTEPLTAGEDVAEAFEAITMRAAITVPLIKSGRFAAALYAHSRAPRRWTQDDESLVREVAERTWSAVERARAEAELRDSEGRFRALATVGPSSVYRMSADWREMRWLHGTGFIVNTEASTNDWMDIYIPADERSRVQKAINGAIAAKGLFELEHRVLRTDGTVGWTFSRAVPLFDDAGEIVEWFGAASDVTERVKADRSFTRLFQASPAPFLVLAPDAPRFTIKEVNDAYLAATMTTRESIVGRGVFEAFPDNPDDSTNEGVSTLRASLERVLATHQPDTLPGLKYDVARPDGSFEERWWSPVNSAVLDDNGEVEAIIHNANDVTEDRRIAAALRASEAAARVDAQRVQLALAAGAIIGTWNWDIPVDRFTADEPFARVFGADPALCREGIPLAAILAAVHPDDQAGLADAIEAATLKGGAYAHQYRVRRNDGHYYWIEANGRVDHGPDGTPLSFPGVLIDVEERRAVEAERDQAIAALRALNETLESRVIERTGELEAAHEQLRQSQKLEAMGSLTGGVAHDFNNLLTPIVGALDMLQRRKLGGEREQRLIGGAAQSAERAKVLVQRLLAFARRQPLQPVAVDVSALVRNMADLVASTTGPQINVVLDVDDALPAAKADPNQLEMALLNLAVNARDAMPNGGTLRISASAGNGNSGQDAHLRPGRYVRLSVADTGIGMDELTLARAVDPFFSTKGVGKGTGLGLSMVHGLATQLGGALMINSKPGLGTNIELWLPETEGLPEAPVVVQEAESSSRCGVALLVDDEEFVRLSTADMLGDLGYRVVEAASADEALKVIENGTHLDLVVTDHLMPGMTGTDLARAVRARRPDLPVLVVSGYAEVDGVAPDLPRLTKPFREDELAASLAGLSSF